MIGSESCECASPPHRVKGVSADQEESLLLQLREITRAMQEGHLVAPQKTDHQHHCEGRETLIREPDLVLMKGSP